MLSLLRNRGVRAKVGRAYGTVTLILIEAGSTTIWQVRRTAGGRSKR